MKRLFFAAALAFATVPALAADVAMSISIGQPGFYGQIDIGGYPPPPVIYQQPRVMYRSAVDRQPIYLNVPRGHAKNWRKHCRQYNACGERVYFVQNNWYESQYVPHYQKQHHDRRDDRSDGRRDNRHDRDDDDRRGQNKGHDNDHGQGRNH